MVEENGADVVQVAVQGEQAAASLVGPDLDLVVIAAGDEPLLLSANCFVGGRMLTMVVFCGSLCRGLARRALRSDL